MLSKTKIVEMDTEPLPHKEKENLNQIDMEASPPDMEVSPLDMEVSPPHMEVFHADITHIGNQHWMMSCILTNFETTSLN